MSPLTPKQLEQYTLFGMWKGIQKVMRKMRALNLTNMFHVDRAFNLYREVLKVGGFHRF